MGYAEGVPELTMPRRPTLWPDPGDLDDHWRWRPEWTVERPCWYWYLTFEVSVVAEAVGSPLLSAVTAVPWLDPVPVAWLHLTVCDVGFTDELDLEVAHEVTEAVATATDGLLPVQLQLGPVAAMHGAVVLAAGPLAPLRRLRRAAGSATQRVLGPRRPLFHRHEFWPHVSLGYVNRAVPRRQVAATLARWPQPGPARAEVDRLTLASVTRRDRHYQWQVSAEVTSAASSLPTTPGRRGSR
jgi:2'-5' RNA ligase